ncbi:MAG TPA: glycosyltransferase family 39 protein [Phycisphaerae bacterium]|nr:glycosyltransferase family 39 protein [Phycisphaerae bacterium]
MLPTSIKNKRRWWSREDLFLLLLFGALFFLPGIGRIALFDRDEPRFATAARTMAQTGNYIVPMFNGELRPDKPPLLYWLMDGTYAITGRFGELGARLPSAICSTLTILVLYFMVGARFGRLTGLLAAILMGSTSLFIVESRLATADATMLLFITICMACAWRAWDVAGSSAVRPGGLASGGFRADRMSVPLGDAAPSRRRDHVPVWMAGAFWVSLAAGALTKGVPLIFVLVPMIVLSLFTGALPALLREWRSHFHLTHIRRIIAVVLAVVTTVAVTFFYRAGLTFQCVSALVLGLLFMAMTLTPRLPGVLFRCVIGGNWRWWRLLRPAWGIPLMIVLIGWWVVAVGLATTPHWTLIIDMVETHFLERSMPWLLHLLHIQPPPLNPTGGNDQVSKYAQPTGFYTLLVWVTDWPWSVLIVPAAYHTWRRLRGRTAVAVDPRPYQFLVAWIVPMWILLEIARGKLVHYPLPTYLAISILFADTLVQSWAGFSEVLSPRWFAVMRWVMMVIWVGMGCTVFFAGRAYLAPELLPPVILLAIVLAAAGAASAWSWNTPRWPFVVALAWAAALLVADTQILPNIAQLRTSEFAGGRVRALLEAEPDYRVAALGYEEPSLIFYTGYRVLEVEGDDFDKLREEVPFATRAQPVLPRSKWVLVGDATLLKSLDDRHLLYFPLQTYRGFNPANFKPVTVTVLTNVPPKDYSPTAIRAATQATPATSLSPDTTRAAP